MIWTDRPLPWQQHCAEVLGREFAPARFNPEQTKRILAALEAALERPVGTLHRVVLEAFLMTLRSASAAAE